MKAIESEILNNLHLLGETEQKRVLNYILELVNRDQKGQIHAKEKKNLALFAGSILPEDLDAMEKAIQEGCEN
ncbi:MAG: hypothetical protein H6581_00375 [Bacteroidia bacterium]|nr:hypothetical protein [Bacteroidia bacterium]